MIQERLDGISLCNYLGSYRTHLMQYHYIIEQLFLDNAVDRKDKN